VKELLFKIYQNGIKPQHMNKDTEQIVLLKMTPVRDLLHTVVMKTIT